MRTKSLQEPTGVSKGHEWLSPVGHRDSWHRIWNGTAWEDFHEVKAENLEEEEDLEEEEIKDEDLPILTGVSPESQKAANDRKATEEMKDEHGLQTEVSDRDGRDEGSGGQSGRKPPADGKQGKGRKGKRK